MAKVLLGDVVNHIKDKVDKDTTDLEFYVGGEHIDGDEITVRRKGLIQGSTIGPAFHMRFQKGDVLLMSRNPHLRKASMVDFDGICSDVSYVCRTKDNNVLLQSLLPFILQTTEFWQFAEENKKGGLPFFLNWKDFARFEFELIPIERQQRIADLLWAMERTKNAYRELIARTDDLVKSQFIEMFSVEKGWPLVKLETLCDSIVRGPFGSALKVSFFVGKGTDTVKVYEQKNAIQKSADLGESYVTQEKYQELKRFSCGPGDFIMSCSGTIGCLYQIPEDAEAGIINQALCKFRLNGKMLPEVFLTYMRNSVDQLETKGSAIKNIGAVSYIKNMEIALPPNDVQQQFAEFIKQSDKSKFAAQQALKELTDAQKALMKKIFE